MAAGLESLEENLAHLNLTEQEEADIVLIDDAGLAPSPRWVAVGKLLSPRPASPRTMEGDMLVAWGLRAEMSCTAVGGNVFVFSFASEGDWSHVMTKGPWSFMRQALVLLPFDGAARPSEMEFSRMQVWVRVHGLPLGLMTRRCAAAVGARVGRKVVEVDADEDGTTWGECLRVRVEIDIGTPLLRCVRVRARAPAGAAGPSRAILCALQYEKIPGFCFACGRVGHSAEECEDEEADKEDLQYGAWLRAPPGRRRWRNQGPATPCASARSTGSAFGSGWAGSTSSDDDVPSPPLSRAGSLGPSKPMAGEGEAPAAEKHSRDRSPSSQGDDEVVKPGEEDLRDTGKSDGSTTAEKIQKSQCADEVIQEVVDDADRVADVKAANGQFEL